ncbi:MAG: hypothetical protein AB1420_00340 [Bacillota bacterium]
MAKLHSLVDLLKKKLYFTEGLTVTELTKLIQEKMLQDYDFKQAQIFVNSCLHQCGCFYSQDNYIWFLDKHGLRENDQFFNMLFKHQRALRFGVANGNKKSRNNSKVVNLPHKLISDGRFVQLEGGNWGLTEWEVDAQEYRLRHVVIKVLSKNPDGLSYSEIFDKVEIWKKAFPNAVRDILHKYKYFSRQDDRWFYSYNARLTYELTKDKYLLTLNKQQLKHLKDKNKLDQKIKTREVQLREILSSKEQVAAALAEKSQLLEDYDHVVQRFAEKDLLLSLRKRELLKCKEEKHKLEKKAASILHQCRLWVEKSRLKEQENEWLTEEIKSLKIQQEEFEEKDRQQRYKWAQMKDKFATEKAELTRENVNLKHQIEKLMTKAKKEEKEYRNELGKLTADLRRILQESEERRYALEMMENEFQDLRKENRLLKAKTKHPLVRFSLKLASIFGR